MDIFIDSSVVIPILIQTPASSTARKFYHECQGDLHTCTMVIQESLFIGIRILAAEILHINDLQTLRTYILAHGYSFAEKHYENTTELFEQMRVHKDSANIGSILGIIKDARVLPADAVIAATCREQDIHTIATRDKDFSRTSFLSIMNPDL